MAQIADVAHVSAVLDAAHQELLWLFWNRSYGVGSLVILTERMVAELQEVEMRWVTSRSREEPETQPTGEERQSIRESLMRLKGAAYEIRAMVHGLMFGGSTKQTPKAQKSASTDRDKVIAKLEAAEKKYRSLGYTRLPLASSTEQGCASGQENSIHVHVGRNDDKQSIIRLLTQAEAEVEAKRKKMPVILPIFGLGGVGKTSLAKVVFHDIRFQDYAKAWVDLHPGRLDLKEIAACIISQVPGAESLDNKDSLDSLAQLLDGGGNRRKLLLVLDDQWVKGYSLDDSYGIRMDELKSMLSAVTNLVVMVTTHSEAIAEHMCSRVVGPYQLQPLAHGMCRAIIKRTSDSKSRASDEGEGDVAVAEEERLVGEIASKCGGLPSAAQALGCIRQSQKWPAAIDKPDIWNNIIGGWQPRDEDSQPPLHSVRVLSHLKQTYQRLPIDLRFLFALCAFIFPEGKGHSIDPCDLMNQLDALGCYPIWSHIACLLDISFLLRAKSPLVSAALLTMNDLVYVLARYVLGERLVVVDSRNMATASSYENASKSACCALVSNLDGTLENLSRILPDACRILALRFEDCSEMKISDGAFSSARHLRLLDLSGYSGRNLPESIGLLEDLRYLNAPGIRDQVLPVSVISGLSSCLRYLSLRGSRQLSDLTKAFGSMKCLVHLDLSDCSGLKSLPELYGAPGVLQHLDLSGCSRLKTLPGSLGTVGSNLRHLNLSGCSCLGGVKEALDGCTELRYLNLSHRCGYSVEDWFHLKDLHAVLAKLKELRFLGISSCLDPLCYALPPEESCKYMDCITSLVKLEHLDLSKNKFLLNLPETIGNLKELRTLDLSGCFRLRSLPHRIGEVNELRTLALSGCPQLNPLPEDTQQQLAKLPFLSSHELLASITGSFQASDSHKERSLIAGANQAEDWASTSQDAARQLRIDPSPSAEREIIEISEISKPNL